LKFSEKSKIFPRLAPSGCLQFYTDPTGFVASFNYASAANPASNAIGVGGTRQIASMKYGACVRAAANMCTITWSQVFNLNFFKLFPILLFPIFYIF
jgi:hypothetical protein